MIATARLQVEPIRPEDLLATLRSPADGAVALFLGTVRDHNAGRRVLYLEYHAYPEMAVAEMERIATASGRSFGASGVAIVHRTGRLEIGEVAVAVAAAAAHRAAAFDACRAAMEEVKALVPIWKKEFFVGGATWV
jgi:molybdopterin synthase catalytic subunit